MASKPDTPFMVILRADLPKEYFTHLYPVLKLMNIRETTAPVIWCSETEESHFYYLAVTAKLIESDGFSHIKIPHHFVLAIAGSNTEKNPMGFVWEDENHGHQPTEADGHEN